VHAVVHLEPREGPMEIELTHCPACGRPAEVIDRFVVFGDRGPIEHVRIRCITGPAFERRVGRWNPGGRPRPANVTRHDGDAG
jgi:hypothetical protein